MHISAFICTRSLHRETIQSFVRSELGAVPADKKWSVHKSSAIWLSILFYSSIPVCYCLIMHDNVDEFTTTSQNKCAQQSQKDATAVHFWGTSSEGGLRREYFCFSLIQHVCRLDGRLREIFSDMYHEPQSWIRSPFYPEQDECFHSVRDLQKNMYWLVPLCLSGSTSIAIYQWPEMENSLSASHHCRIWISSTSAPIRISVTMATRTPG